MPQQHFDVVALLKAVLDQPIGLCVSTNHPAGFRRLLYLEGRKNPALAVQILQSPESASAFLLVRKDVQVSGQSESENG